MNPLHTSSEQHDGMQPMQSVHLAKTNSEDPQQSSSGGSQPPTMTLLESLEPIRQQQIQSLNSSPHLSSLMEPLQQRGQHIIQAPQNHLVQPQPHLHQLQPSHQHPGVLQTLQDVGANPDQEPQTASHSMGRASAGSSNRLAGNSSGSQQRSTLIVRLDGSQLGSDGGGPIVQWLLDNYEIAEGESLPRSTVYNHYLTYCDQLQMASVNAASFGKIIRSVFIGLKTRRLGTRGHSKYHYFGVRAKGHTRHALMQHEDQLNGSQASVATDNGSESDSNPNSFNDCQRQPIRNRAPPKRLKRNCSNTSASAVAASANNNNSNSSSSTSDQTNYAQENSIHLGQHPVYHHEQDSQQRQIDMSVAQRAQDCYQATNNGITAEYIAVKSGLPSDSNIQGSNFNHCNQSEVDLVSFLGANWTTLVDENWPHREPCQLEQRLMEICGSEELAHSLTIFENEYKFHYRRMIELLSELRFQEIEFLWEKFWHPEQPLQSATAAWHQSQTQITDNNSSGNPSGSQLVPEPNHIYQIQDHDYHNQLHSQQMETHSSQCNEGQVGRLTYHILYQLTSQPEVIQLISHIDCRLYSAIESFLLPDMLRKIPIRLSQLIRLFAKNIKPWIEQSIKDYDPNLVEQKCRDARAFGNALRRYTEINHLSTASRAIWERRSALAQMSLDLSRVDLNDVEHQVTLMSLEQEAANNQRLSTLHRPKHQATSNSMNENQNRDSESVLGGSGSAGNQSEVQQQNKQLNPLTSNHHANQNLFALQPAQLIQNFLHLLEEPFPADTWPDWCRNLVESRVSGTSIDEGRNFLLKWNFYISLVMKELLLKRAPSCSSFHLIKLLFDAYIYYLVDSRLAQAQHQPKQLPSDYC